MVEPIESITSKKRKKINSAPLAAPIFPIAWSGSFLSHSASKIIITHFSLLGETIQKNIFLLREKHVEQIKRNVLAKFLHRLRIPTQKTFSNRRVVLIQHT